MWIVEIILGMAAVALALPVGVLLVECLAAAWPEPDEARPGDELPPGAGRTVVMVPAHNEAAGIAGTVRSLHPQLGPKDRMLVIADNCDDATAAAAREAGAVVLERNDPDHRGKGYAIAFGLQHLDADPPGVVVLVDADCRLSENAVQTLARQALDGNRPAQAEYLIAAPENPTPLSAVSALAVLVRNRVRPRGLRRLGLPCQLTGSGMAFPWAVLREAPSTGSNLVEDLVMGVEMALMGYPPVSCPSAAVSSELPEADGDAHGQRRRWEHGHLATLGRYGPRLLWRGIREARLDLLGLGLDLIVPPLSLLVALLGLLALLCAPLAMTGGSTIPLMITAGTAAGLTVAIMTAWLRYGRHTLPLRFLIAMPAYVLWKLPLYLSIVGRRRQRTWERTRRPNEDARPGTQDGP